MPTPSLPFIPALTSTSGRYCCLVPSRLLMRMDYSFCMQISQEIIPLELQRSVSSLPSITAI